MYKCKYTVNADGNMAYEIILNFLNQVINQAGRTLIYTFLVRCLFNGGSFSRRKGVLKQTVYLHIF